MHEIGKEAGTPVYVDELDTPRDVLSQNPLETIDELLTRIQSSQRFVCLLGPTRHGSRIDLEIGQAHASFWEMELFFAALSKIPTSIVVIDGFSPEPRLQAVLEILRDSFPRREWIEVQNKQAAADWLRRQLSPTPIASLLRSQRSLRRYLVRLVERLFLQRGTSCEFLGGQLHDPSVKPDFDLIESLFAEADSTRDERGKLSRLWLVGRELMGTKLDSHDDCQYLPLWNRFFRDWASAGAWYGLHSHIHMGCLAALEGAVRVAERARAAQDALGIKDFDPDVLSYPGGALASARYSISKNMNRRRLKRKVLLEAAEDIERSLAEASRESTANLISIRGSINRQLFRFSQAVRDYEEVVSIRQASNASDSQLGEALTELGYGYLFQGRLLKGRDLLLNGLSLMDPNTGRVGFYIRAKKKLAAAYFATGNWKCAAQQRAEARELAERYNALDQR